MKFPSARPGVPVLVVLVAGSLTGCATFKPPPITADGPTVPTGVYDTPAEKWTDEAKAAERKQRRADTERVLRKMERD